MRPISIVLIVIAGLAAVTAIFVGKRMVQDRAAAAAAAQKIATADVDVLVAAHDLPQGRLLVDSDLQWVRWPRVTAETTHAIVRENSQDALAQAPGTAARRNITAGEPISADNLFTPGRTGFMAMMVTPGMKAVGVTVTAASTASGFVLPGDFVDVVLTVDLRRTEVSLPGGGRFASEIILHNVRVLAVDQTLTPGVNTTSGSRSKHVSSKTGTAQAADAPPEDAAMVGKTVALEVTPADGERLLAAQAAGTLSLALRSLALADSKDDPNHPFISDVESSRALQLAIGGGAVRVVKGGENAR